MVGPREVRAVRVRVGFPALILSLFWGAGLPQPAAAQAQAQPAEPRSALERAALLYDQGKFEEAIQVAQLLVSTGGTPASDVQSAREWVARSQIKLGRRIEGKQTFKDILRDDPQYRPDPLRVPPDEIEVFNTALQETLAAQVSTGWPRGPSIFGFVGYGIYSNGQFNDSLETQFEADVELTHGIEFGGAVRVPLRGRLAAQLEVMRFSTSDTDSNEIEYKVSALPIVLSLVYDLRTGTKTRLSLFAGGGPMINTEFEFRTTAFIIPISVTGSKTGAYFHGGIEGEYLVGRHYSLVGRVLGRYAKASDVEYEPQPDNFTYDIDFNGPAFGLGVRAYLGG